MTLLFSLQDSVGNIFKTKDLFLSVILKVNTKHQCHSIDHDTTPFPSSVGNIFKTKDLFLSAIYTQTKNKASMSKHRPSNFSFPFQGGKHSQDKRLLLYLLHSIKV